MASAGPPRTASCSHPLDSFSLCQIVCFFDLLDPQPWACFPLCQVTQPWPSYLPCHALLFLPFPKITFLKNGPADVILDFPTEPLWAILEVSHSLSKHNFPKIPERPLFSNGCFIYLLHIPPSYRFFLQSIFLQYCNNSNNKN